MSRFKEQLPKTRRPERPERVRQTFLSTADACRHSAYLSLKHPAKGHPLTRGSLVHLFIERATNVLIAEGERQLPPDVAKDLMQSILDEAVEVDLPAYEQDAARICANHWAECTLLDPDTFVGCELPLTLEIDGWTITGTLDRLDIREDTAFIADAKTGLGVPSQAEFENKPQLPTYGALLMFGTIRGEKVPLGAGINMISMKEVYPRLDPIDGELVFRHRIMDRREVTDHLDSLRGLVKRLSHSFETGYWPATPGSHCRFCPAPQECPILDELDPAPLENLEQARELAIQQHLHKGTPRKATQLLRGWVEKNGNFTFGRDMEVTVETTERRKTINADQLEEAVMASANFGAPFDRARFFSSTIGSRLVIRKVEDDS